MNRIVWSEEGIYHYQELLEHNLPNIQVYYSGKVQEAFHFHDDLQITLKMFSIQLLARNFSLPVQTECGLFKLKRYYVTSMPSPTLSNLTTQKSMLLRNLKKLKVADFWKQKYIAQIKDNNITSLRYFKPEKCSLLHPTPPPRHHHPLLHTAGHAYDVNKMVVQLRLLSERA